LAEYRQNETAEIVVERLSKEINGIDDLTIVGHSLGGIIGVELLALSNVKKLFTMSTPFGGHPAAFLMMWTQAMFRDLIPYGKTIRLLQKKWTEANKPHLAIVTTSGLSFLDRENDGVVTVESQQELMGPDYHHFDTNHFEVLLEEKTVKLLKNFVWE